jgi:hypothetical protein
MYYCLLGEVSSIGYSTIGSVHTIDGSFDVNDNIDGSDSKDNIDASSMRVLAPAFGKIEEVERINTSLADHGMNFSA